MTQASTRESLLCCTLSRVYAYTRLRVVEDYACAALSSSPRTLRI